MLTDQTESTMFMNEFEIPSRREWLPTPVFLPEEFHGQRSLAGYSPWDHKESDMTQLLTFTFTVVENGFSLII